MSAISLKSITGITSITTPAGLDNQLTLHTNNTVERLRIDSSGNIGINSTAPNTALDVIAGSSGRTWTPGTSVVSMFERNGHTRVTLTSGASSYGEIDFGDTNDDNAGYIRYDHSDNSMSIRTNTDERLRINSDGKIGIATNTGSGLINTRHAGTNQQVFQFRADLGSSNGRSLNLYTPDTDNSTAPFRFQTGNGYLFQCDGANVFTIAHDRRVGINSTAPTNTLVVREETDNNPSIQLFRPSTGGDIANIIWATNQGNQASINYRGAAPAGMQFYTGGTGSSNLRAIITLTGKVGIGTDSPAEKLSVEDSSPAILINATSATGESKLQFGRLGNTNVGEIKYEHSNNAFTFRTNDGADRLRIKSDGKVGIGINNPTAKLHVSGNSTPTILNKPTDASPALFVGDSNRTGAGQHLAEFRGNWNGTNVARIVFHAGDDTTNKDNGEITFRTAAAGSTIERLRIDSGGRVLINTSSNTNAHTQSDDLVVGNTSHGHDTGITIVSNPSYSGWLAFSDGTSADEQRKAGLVYQHSSDTLYLRNNGNQNRLRITSDGLIQAETRSAGVRRMILSGSPSNSAFNIEAHDGATGTSANTNQGELGLYYNDGTTLTDEAVIKFYRGSGAGDGYFGFNTGSNERLRITSRGYREIRNYHYGSWAFTNNTWKTTITVGDPGDHNFTTIKLILTLRDGSYRQHLWQGEYTIFASNAAGGPSVNYYLKEHWQHAGSGNWSNASVSVQITSGGALQVKANNSHNDAAGDAYIHILDVIGDIDGSSVATISS